MPGLAQCGTCAARILWIVLGQAIRACKAKDSISYLDESY